MPANQSYTDKDVLERVAHGDEAAFRQLFNHYYNHIYGFVLSVLKNVPATEEVTQDVFLQVWKSRHQLTEILGFADWLFIIARNKSYSALKKQLRDPEWTARLDSIVLTDDTSTEQRLLLKESLQILEKAASTLPEQQRIIFRLSRLEDFSLDEIAEKLQISKHTVKYHLTKALAAVRAYLAAHHEAMLLPLSAILFF